MDYLGDYLGPSEGGPHGCVAPHIIKNLFKKTKTISLTQNIIFLTLMCR